MVDSRDHRIGSRGEGVDWEGLSALANRHLAKIVLVLLVVLVGMFGYFTLKIGNLEDRVDDISEEIHEVRADLRRAIQDHSHVCPVVDGAYGSYAYCD